MRRLLAILLMAVLLCCTACDTRAEGTGTRLIALNIGKADCLLLLFSDQAYLIDAGYDRTYGSLREALRQYGVTRLNGVFLTHCDKDHYGGLAQLAESGIAVDAWYAAAIYYDIPKNGHPMEAAAALRGEAVTWLSAGDRLALSDEATLTVLGPLTRNTENENNNSLVFTVETADGVLLFTGDMKLEEEAELLAAGLFSAADVLKVPFHGDNTASSLSFVDAVQPQAAVICTSAAEEPDTPASSVVKRYARAGAVVAVTQDATNAVRVTLQKGRVLVEDDGWDVPDYSGVVTAEVDLAEDLLTLRNGGKETIALDGWIIYSTRGEDCVVLPDGLTLPAGRSLTLGTRATGVQADVTLDNKRIWHKSKYDLCIVYDACGGVAAVTDNGMPE